MAKNNIQLRAQISHSRAQISFLVFFSMPPPGPVVIEVSEAVHNSGTQLIALNISIIIL